MTTDTMPHEDHETAGLNAFENNLEISKRIKEKGSFRAYTETLPGFRGAFTPPGSEQHLKCCDERIKRRGLANPGGVLYDLIVHNVPEEELADLYKANNVKVLSSHAGCGAAKAAMSIATKTEQTDWKKIDEWAKERTKAFVDKFAKSHGFTYEHIQANELEPQGHMHPGTAIYLDDVGGFNPQDVEGLEQGYVVSGSIAKNPVDSVRALIQLVAFGSGNAGDLIRKRKIQWGFTVYIIAPNESARVKRVAEVDRMLRALPPDIRPYTQNMSIVVA